MTLSIMEQINRLQISKDKEPSEKRNIKKMFTAVDKKILSKWAVFRVVAEIVPMSYKQARAILDDCPSITDSNWWHNGSHRLINKGLANDELFLFINTCNNLLSNQQQKYRIPSDLFEQLFSHAQQVQDMIMNHCPNTNIEAVKICVLEQQTNSRNVQQNESYNNVDFKRCVNTLDLFLGKKSEDYAVLHGASDLDVNMLLSYYADHISINEIISNRKVQSIFFDVSKTPDIESFLIQIWHKLSAIESKNQSREQNKSKCPSNSNTLKDAVIKLLKELPDGFVLMLSGLTEGLMSLNLCQEIYRTLKNDDFCRLLVEIVAALKGSGESKTIKIIFGFSGALARIRAEFASAEQVLLKPPSKNQWLNILSDLNMDNTQSIIARLSRPTIKPQIIRILMSFEKFTKKNPSVKDMSFYYDELVTAINHHNLEKVVGELLTKCKQGLSLACIAFSDDGLTSESLTCILKRLRPNEEIKLEAVKGDIKLLRPLLLKVQGEDEYTYEVREPILSMLTNVWFELEEETMPSSSEIHFAIAQQALQVAYENNNQNRHIQALRHMLKAIPNEHIKNPQKAYVLTLCQALSKFKNYDYRKINEQGNTQLLIQIAWVYYYHQIEQQKEHDYSGIIKSKNNKRNECSTDYSTDTFDQSSSTKNHMLKSEMLRWFCSIGLTHEADHFYLPEVFKKSISKQQLLTFLSSYSVNAYNRLDYNDLEKSVGTYHYIFAEYERESPKRVIDLAIANDPVYLFARESLSRVTICHIRKLFDQGQLSRVRSQCSENIGDINLLIEHGLNFYVQLKASLAVQKKQMNTAHMDKEQTTLLKLQEFIRKLLKRRIRFESILLRLYCQRAQWDMAHEHFLRVQYLAENAFEALNKWQEVKTLVTVTEFPDLFKEKPQLCNRPLIHCLDYLICFAIHQRAKFGLNDEKYLFPKMIENIQSSLVIDIDNYKGKQLAELATLNELWLMRKKQTEACFKSTIAKHSYLYNPRSHVKNKTLPKGFKWDDFSALASLSFQYDEAAYYPNNLGLNKRISARKTMLTLALNPLLNITSPQMKLYFELERFKVMISEIAAEKHLEQLTIEVAKLEQLLMMLQEKGLTVWYIDALLIYTELLNHKVLKTENTTYSHEREKALIIANQMIEKSTYAYREMDLLMQQYPDEAIGYRPIMIR